MGTGDRRESMRAARRRQRKSERNWRCLLIVRLALRSLTLPARPGIDVPVYWVSPFSTLARCAPVMNRLFLLAMSLMVCLTPCLRAQVAPEKAEATFKVVDGLQYKLWASEPLFVNPTCMDVDHKGRVWVCESVNYRNRLRGFKKLTRPEGDRIVILEDTKGNGTADKATTFYQSPDTLAPLGIAVAKNPVGPGYKVFVCQSPDILVFEDKDGDGKADGPPKKLLGGFGGFDHDHGVHGILIGPDNKLYFSVGDRGVH